MGKDQHHPSTQRKQRLRLAADVVALQPASAVILRKVPEQAANPSSTTRFWCSSLARCAPPWSPISLYIKLPFHPQMSYSCDANNGSTHLRLSSVVLSISASANDFAPAGPMSLPSRLRQTNTDTSPQTSELTNLSSTMRAFFDTHAASRAAPWGPILLTRRLYNSIKLSRNTSTHNRKHQMCDGAIAFQAFQKLINALVFQQIVAEAEAGS